MKMFTHENRWILHTPMHYHHPALLHETAHDALYKARVRFTEQFHRLHAQAIWRRFWAMLIRRSDQCTLLSLAAFRAQGKIAVRSQQSLQLVPIDHILGSEGRCGDFDADFRPLITHDQERWINIAIAHSRGQVLPPVKLVQVKAWYFVRDGHHRISVAKSQGQVAIEAEVVVWN